ncbi:MAG: TOBE domain-containing protein, partial [Lachnospiraceae bacterium]|nr:TOBE domain-containing protein [Lachnospiraceae bacterium]
AIIRKVGIFLMDEPLSNLDAKQRVTMRSEITQIHKEIGATTIYVTHDQTEAMTMADRIVVMKDGYVQQVGTPHDLYFEPANVFVAGFIGEPPMNFVKGTVKDGKVAFGDQCIDLTKKMGERIREWEGKEMILGFRPEAIVLGEQEDSYHLTCEVELSEMLGDVTNLYVFVGEEQAILKVDPHEVPQLGSSIPFSIAYKNLYLFDGDTEMAIK